MIVTRIKRRSKGVWVFPDGYRYEWPPYGGELDVLPRHAEVLLALEGFEAVQVEVVDPPLILPAFDVTADTMPVTIEPAPEVVDPPLDLTGAHIDAPPVEPEPEPEPIPVTPEPDPVPVTLIVDEPEPVVLDLTGVPVDPPVLPPPPAQPDTTTEPLPVADVRKARPVKVSHRWSEQEIEQARREGGEL